MNSATLALLGEKLKIERQLEALAYQDLRDNYVGQGIGLSNDEVESYSLLRAIDAHAKGDWKRAGLEKSAHEATAKLLGREAKGFFLPPEIKARNARYPTGRFVTRDFTLGNEGSPGGGYGSLNIDVRGESFIQLLRNTMVIRVAGATILSDLQGNVFIPKQSAGTTAYWVNEGAAPAASAPVIEQIELKPKTVGGYTEISRKLIVQSSVDVENFVVQDLATTLALAIDKAAISGAGGDEPIGLANIQWVGSIDYNGEIPTWADLVGLDTSLGNASVSKTPMDKFAYLSAPELMGKLKYTPKVSQQASFLCEGDRINSYPAFMTNQMEEDGRVLFGKWNDLIIAEWTATDILVDPYTSGKSGAVRVIVLQDVDIAVRYPQSFCFLKPSQ